MDNVFNVILIGDARVGKTCLLNKLQWEEFTEKYLETIGMNYGNKTFDIDKKKTKLKIWDLSGQEKFRILIRPYYRGIHGAIVAYDCTNRKSFEHVRDWLAEINEQDHGSTDKAGLPVKILIGNKCDVSESEREVSSEEGSKLADEHNIDFFETSAKTSHNVETAFKKLASQMGTLVNAAYLQPVGSSFASSMEGPLLDDAGVCPCKSFSTSVRRGCLYLSQCFTAQQKAQRANLSRAMLEDKSVDSASFASNATTSLSVGGACSSFSSVSVITHSDSFVLGRL